VPVVAILKRVLTVWSRRGRFIAYDDHGRGYEIRYSTGSLDNDTSEEMGGDAELWTAAGELVEWLQKGKYRIVHTGVLIRSDSPQAP
jgi:hypothetical protein